MNIHTDLRNPSAAVGKSELPGFVSVLSAKPVRRVIRHQTTHAYFGRQGWTQNPEQAWTFQDVVEAAKTCNQYGLKNVELVLQPALADTELFRTTLR